MAELTTLARPYAKAAFEYAYAQKQLAFWSEALTLLAAIVGQDNVKKVLKNPALTSKQQADIVLDICAGEIDESVKNFVKALAENKRLMLLSEIGILFHQLKSDVEKTLDVHVITAFELNVDSEESLKNALAKKLSCEVNIENTIDKTLIGGIVIRAGDMIIDGSVKGRLTKLAEAMNSRV
jgi:F-type H+-transporting ATPase subunit delta